MGGFFSGSRPFLRASCTNEEALVYSAGQRFCSPQRVVRAYSMPCIQPYTTGHCSYTYIYPIISRRTSNRMNRDMRTEIWAGPRRYSGKEGAKGRSWRTAVQDSVEPGQLPSVAFFQLCLLLARNATVEGEKSRVCPITGCPLLYRP